MTLRMISRTARCFTFAAAVLAGASAVPTALHAQTKTATVVTKIPEAEASKMIMLSPSTTYPAAAGKATGTVVVKVKVDATGKPTVLGATGPAVFQKTAKESAAQYRYHPYEVKGVPKPFETTITMHFAPA